MTAALHAAAWTFLICNHTHATGVPVERDTEIQREREREREEISENMFLKQQLD